MAAALWSIAGVACLEGVEGSGMAGPDETLGIPFPPLAIRPCWDQDDDDVT
jgi:hypothetical protein